MVIITIHSLDLYWKVRHDNKVLQVKTQRKKRQFSLR